MRCRRYAILASMLLLFWCSGAARYVHERIEHADTAAGAQGNPHDEDHEHDNCPVCQSLAAILLQTPTPVFVPTPTLERVAAVQPTERIAPALPIRFTLPSTGPPTV